MSALPRLLCVCLACIALAACGSSSGGSSGSNKQQITNLFTAVDSEMAHGDYTSACQHFSAHQQSNIIAGVKRAGLKASTCPEAMTSLIKATGITRAQLAQAFGGAAAPKVRSISVHGNQATVTFTNSVGGHPYTETDALVREGGQWKADRIIKRTNN